MSDAELNKRLRDFEKVTVGDARDAADRIEQLVATNEALGKACTEWAEVSQSNYQRAKTSEAKLEKAVGALDRLVALNDDYSPFGGEMFQDRVERTWQKARATLAELKGESHE